MLREIEVAILSSWKKNEISLMYITKQALETKNFIFEKNFHSDIMILRLKYKLRRMIEGECHIIICLLILKH